MCYINKCTPYKSAIIANLKGVFLVEARRIELLSENLSTQASPSAVCPFHSLIQSLTNKLKDLVSSYTSSAREAPCGDVHH